MSRGKIIPSIEEFFRSSSRSADHQARSAAGAFARRRASSANSCESDGKPRHRLRCLFIGTATRLISTIVCAYPLYLNLSAEGGEVVKRLDARKEEIGATLYGRESG